MSDAAHSQHQQPQEVQLLEGQASIVGHPSAQKVTSQQHSSDCGKKLTIHFTPKDDATKAAMHRAKLNPALELSCRSDSLDDPFIAFQAFCISLCIEVSPFICVMKFCRVLE